MYISDKMWSWYIEQLDKIDKTAANKMHEYLSTHEWWKTNAAKKATVEYAYALATKYGEAGAEVACEMYDIVANDYAKRFIPPAEPAKTATYSETRKAIYGAMKTDSDDVIVNAVSRLVKLGSADTMLNNTLRDGAEFAWIPQGEHTCAYCMTLASRGWQKASKAAIKDGHAEHIHANCQCTYVVRFDDKTDVQGYNPNAYLRMYNSADPGGSPQDKINALRREIYASDADRINVQKRAAYAAREDSGT